MQNDTCMHTHMPQHDDDPSQIEHASETCMLALPQPGWEALAPTRISGETAVANFSWDSKRSCMVADSIWCKQTSYMPSL